MSTQFPKYYCNSCKNFTSDALRKGNGWIELILDFFYLIPGIIYSIWRRSGEPNVCPLCKKDSLILASMVNSTSNSVVIEEIRNERECPYCAEKILVKAKICKHCGADVDVNNITKEITPEKIKVDFDDRIIKSASDEPYTDLLNIFLKRDKK